MKIGVKDINRCGSCPACTWAGESIRLGDCGHYCSFSMFKVEPTTVPNLNICPLLQLFQESARDF